MAKKIKNNIIKLKTNLEKIKELTATAVPFVDTIDVKVANKLLGSEEGIEGNLRYIHKEDKFAIVVGEINEGFVHKHHYHDEVEVLCLLKGKATIIFNDRKMELEQNKPLIIEPNSSHTVEFIEDTEILAITIPAGKGFPDA